MDQKKVLGKRMSLFLPIRILKTSKKIESTLLISAFATLHPTYINCYPVKSL